MKTTVILTGFVVSNVSSGGYIKTSAN